MTDDLDYMPSRVTLPDYKPLPPAWQYQPPKPRPLRDRLDLGELVLLIIGQVHEYASADATLQRLSTLNLTRHPT